MNLINIFNPTGECKAAISFMVGQKIMYQPYCSNRFNKSRGCRIKKGVQKPCQDCPVKDILPVTEEMIQRHMNGNDNLIGIYPLVGSMTPWVAADFDNHDGKRKPSEDVQKVLEMARNLDLPISIFTSRSGSGYHVYIFFDGMVPAVLARRLMYALLLRAEVVKNSSFDAIFPKQDQLAHGETGNLIALPWHGKSFEAGTGGSRFVHPDLDEPEAIHENIDSFLFALNKLDENELRAMLSSMGESTETTPDFRSTTPKATPTSYRGPRADDLPSRLQNVIDKCSFIRHCRDNAPTLSEPEWYSMICILATSYGGPALVHKFSKRYPKYTAKETNDKIIHALNDQPGPIRCESIRALSPDVCNGCTAGVVCPVHLCDLTTPVDSQDLEWLTTALMGVVEGKRRTTAKAICRYHLANGREPGAVEEALRIWNVRNIPPLPEEDLPQILGESLNRRGMDAFSNAIGVNVTHLERVIQADRETFFLMYIEGEQWPAKLQPVDFVNKSGFRTAVLGITNRLVAVPSGKGSSDRWTSLVNSLLSESETIYRSEEESVISVIKRAIMAMVRLSERHEGVRPDRDPAFIYEGKVYLKLNQLKIAVSHIPELKKMNHGKLVDLLRIIGFKYLPNGKRIPGYRVRVFECDQAKFDIYREVSCGDL